MPVFNDIEIRQLQALQDRRTKYFYHKTANRLMEKSLIFPIQKLGQTMEVEISDYGRRVLAFYRAIKAGQVKTKLNQCHGCQNPC